MENQQQPQQKKVSVEGYILATDISPQMLAIAKERTVSLGLQNIVEFKEVDAEKILDLQQQPLSPFVRSYMSLRADVFSKPVLPTLTNIYELLSSGGRIGKLLSGLNLQKFQNSILPSIL